MLASGSWTLGGALVSKPDQERTIGLGAYFAKTGSPAQLRCCPSEGKKEKVTTVSVWPRCPTLYEINTWVWLSELSLKTGASVDLSTVPPAEWDAIAKFGFDAV